MKTAFFCLLSLLLGLALGLMINIQVMGDVLFSPPSQNNTLPTTQTAQDGQTNTPRPNPNTTVTTPDAQLSAAELDGNSLALLTRAYTVLETIKNQDYTGLSEFVHPELGVTFTPYSTVDSSSDRTFKPGELAKAKSNTTLYIWGLRDGSGAPIQSTLTEYFSDFVYNADYLNANLLGINQVLSSGNSLENVTTAYPDASFVEFYIPGTSTDGLGWCGLKLVFQLQGAEYMLVGIIHSEWTT